MSSVFLLHTENTDPLLRLVDRLVQQVQANDEVIAAMLAKVDALAFPARVAPERGDSDAVDELRYHLDSKYGLSELPDHPRFGAVADPVVRRLLNDNYKLVQIQNHNQVRNSELFKIIQQYQDFTNTELLPELRRDYERHLDMEFANFRKVADFKTSKDITFWQAYAKYVEFLHRLFVVLRQMVAVLRRLDDERVAALEVKMVALQALLYGKDGV